MKVAATTYSVFTKTQKGVDNTRNSSSDLVSATQMQDKVAKSKSGFESTTEHSKLDSESVSSEQKNIGIGSIINVKV